MIGKTLAHYEIVEKLGVGGMGEVYRARDTKLDRDVALKIMPADMADNADRAMRFEREAKAVAALKHPHIVTIHSVEHDNDTHFLVMELVDGKTLSDLIPRDGMSLERFIEIALPLTEAMTAAHAKGITHRDIKPANIMVGGDGQLKVLDFGLAKLLDAADPESALTMTSETATQEGKILGTVAYMSPEQAEGKPVDPRSDVFSLGILFYEMSTGERPFKGDTSISTISSILREEPTTITELNRTMPRHLGRIVKRCLAKDPDRRYQSAHDLRNDLLELKEGLDSGEVTVGESSAAAATPAKNRQRGFVVGLGLVAVAAVIAVLVMSRTGDQKTLATTTSDPKQTMEIIRLTNTGSSIEAAISEDGRYVAHVVLDRGQYSLWVTQVSTSSSVEIIPSSKSSVFDPIFSPEGDFIYYLRVEDGAPKADLFRIPVLGGTAQSVLESVGSTVSFSPDGSQFAFLRRDLGTGESNLVITDRNGSNARVVATRSFPQPFNEGPAWSPDGKILAAPVISLSDGVHSWIAKFPIEGGDEQILGPKRWTGVSEMMWLPDGNSLVFVATENFMSTQLWEVSYPSGTARRITNDTSQYNGVSLTADGNTLAAGMDESAFNIWTVMLDGSTPPRQLSQGAKVTTIVGSWTKDGKILYNSDASGSVQVWMMDENGSNPIRLTSEAFNQSSRISPDGKTIVFLSTRGDGVHIWTMGRDGANQTQLTHGNFEVDPQISPDGKWVVYWGGDKQSIFKIPIEGGEPEKLTTTRSQAPAISPDGKHIAYLSYNPATGKAGVFIIPFDGGDPTQILDIPSNGHRWTPDGTAIAYMDEKDGVGNIWLQPLAGGEPSKLTQFTTDEINSFAWSPDGKQIAVSRGRTTSDVVLLKNFR